MSKNKVSIKEIAKLSGVSVATVSRVINNNGRFSEDTRQKVLTVIREMNYETNNVAKSLRMNKSNSIGILVPDISNAFFASIVQHLEKMLFDEGYSTIICNTTRSKEKELAYLKILESKMIDGLFVISGAKEFDNEVLNKHIPVVCIDRKPKDNNTTILIQSDNYHGGFLATEILIKKGCKNIALLAHKETSSSFKNRHQGYIDALRTYGLDFNKDNLVEVKAVTKQSSVEDAKAILTEKFKNELIYDGIFALNDRLAIGAIEAASELGIKIPKDIKIIGFDNDPISNYCFPKLTTIKQDTEILARKACSALLGLMDGQQMPIDKNQMVPVELVVRETT